MSDSVNTNGRMKKEFITPRKALAYLEGNKDNRKVKETHVANLVASMQDGAFILSSDPIVIDIHGLVVNGQHRLWAVVLSGKGQWFWVLKYAPVETRTVIDRIKARTYVDNCGLPGFSNADMSAIRNFYEQPSQALYRVLWTDSSLGEAIKKTEDSLSFVKSTFGGRVRYVSCAGATAALMRAYYHIDHKDLAKFIAVLKDPSLSYPGHPEANAVRLREFLIINPLDTGWGARVMIYCKTQAALQAFRDKRILKKIIEVREDVFPIPQSLKIELKHRERLTHQVKRSLKEKVEELYGKSA